MAGGRAELARLEAARASFAESGTCPACGQRVAKKDAGRHAGELRDQIKDVRRAFRSLESAAEGLTQKVEAAAKALSASEDELYELEAAERRADSSLRLLEREAATARAQLTQAEAELARVEGEENPHREAAQEARRRLRAVEAELGEKEARARKLAASVERAEFWARGFRDIRLGIIDDILDDLRATTAEVLDGLGLGDWEVNFTTERETKRGSTSRALAVEIRSISAPEGIKWGAYSGGETQRLRLAGALALSEVLLAHAGASVDFRVLDEPTRGLSREGVADLVEVLGDYAERAGLKIFMIDHMAVEGARFASTITIEHAAGGARVRA
jgi:DNA repair exonuclease SbcCD ATPase subunit